MTARLAAALLLPVLGAPLAAPAIEAQASAPASAAARRSPRPPALAVTDRYDDHFRKYSKRFFGVGFDWRYFKAQGMAESGLEPTARSRVGARGIMQLMPSTFQLIQSRRPEMVAIDHPEWNIAAGILHDRYLWRLFGDHAGDVERRRFMFASYNAGERTIQRACRVAEDARLDHLQWSSIERVAARVPRWRHQETVGYVRRIETNHRTLAAGGRAKGVRTVSRRTLAAAGGALPDSPTPTPAPARPSTALTP